jgi:hypothetical protein
MIDPIPHADDGDVAEQARSVYDDVDESEGLTGELRENSNADAGDLLEQQVAVPGDGEEQPQGDGP